LILDTPAAPTELLDWKFLGDLCEIYHASTAVKGLIAETWEGYRDQISSRVEAGKGSLIEQLSSKNASKSPDIFSNIRRLTVLAFVHPPIGHVLMTGSDYPDSIVAAYQANKTEELNRICRFSWIIFLD
jgi:activating signal cointegrator complex subunit 2